MMEFFKDEFLKLVRCFALLGVDTGLSKQILDTEFGLCQQQPQTGVLCHQNVLRRCWFSQRQIGVFVDFEHNARISLSIQLRTYLSSFGLP